MKIEIEVYWTAVVTILSIAYPILLQVIAQLEGKYSSEQIVKIYESEWSRRWFKWTLIFSLCSIVLWSVQLPPIDIFPQLVPVLNNSGEFLLAFSAIALVVLFFFFIEKILTYFIPAKFVQYLIKGHLAQKNSLDYFNAITDVFFHSIKNQNETLTETISRFYYDAFRKEREKQNNQPVEYPPPFYDMNYKAIEELAIISSKKNTALEYRSAGGLWLLGELRENEISEMTYVWLWRNIRLMLRYDQDDMILYYWERAHHYITYSIPTIWPDFDKTNQTLVDKRKKAQDRFFEFHFAMGGLLLYEKKYSCIDRIFKYTTSQPPTYELLPDSMTEIFMRYFEFTDQHNTDYSWISSKYGFPRLDGLNSDNVIKYRIGLYLAVLFLRQYTIHPYLITMKPLAFPTLPASLGGKGHWSSNLRFFKASVEEILANKELLVQLGFDKITPEWCAMNQRNPAPLDFLNEFQKFLEAQYESQAQQQPVAVDKETAFKKSSSDILRATISSISRIGNVIPVEKDFRFWFLVGGRVVFKKDAFSSEPESHYMNYDSYLASAISTQMNESISYQFLACSSKSYLIKPAEMFDAIDKAGRSNEHIIVCFGINLASYKNKELSGNKYKGTEIIQFDATRTVRQAIFLLKKSDLPFIKHVDLESATKTKFELEILIQDYLVYAKVKNLNEATSELITEIQESNKGVDLAKSVLLNLDLSMEVRWKKGIQLIQFIEYSEYRQKGLPNSLSEIE